MFPLNSTIVFIRKNLLTAKLEKAVARVLRTTTPSFAVTLYFPQAARPGRENNLN